MRQWMIWMVCGVVLAGNAMAQEPAAAPDAAGQEEEVSAPAPDYRFQLKIRGWFTDFDAETSELRSLRNSRLSLADELGADADNVPELHLRWQISQRNALKLQYTKLGASGDENVFKGVRVSGDLRGVILGVESDVDLHYGRLGWRHALVKKEEDTFVLETILDAAIFGVSADYRVFSPLLPWVTRDKDDLSYVVGLPVIGLAASVKPVGFLSLFGEFSGMTGGSYGYLFDAEAGVALHLHRNFGIEAGYRYFTVRGEDGDKDAEFSFDGPFIGARVQF